MDWDESGRPQDDDSQVRVRVRTRVVQSDGGVALRTAPLRRGLRDIEMRFLAIQSNARTRAPSEALAGCLVVLDELRKIDGRLHNVAGRRDIPYFTERRLMLLNDYCQWLIRRVGTELLLILRVHLERELRRMISPDAYQVFERLEEVEDTARELEAGADQEIMARVRDGSLFRDILDQVRLRDVVGLTEGETGQNSSGDVRFP